MKLAITIDVDGDIMYVPESTHGFVNHPKPKLFDNIEDAEEERKKQAMSFMPSIMKRMIG